MRQGVCAGLLGLVGILGVIAWGWQEPPVAAPPRSYYYDMLRQAERQAALLDRIAGVLERWEAERQAAKATKEEQRHPIILHYERMDSTGGVPELPTSFGKKK